MKVGRFRSRLRATLTGAAIMLPILAAGTATAPAAAAGQVDTYIVVGNASPAALEAAGHHVTGGSQDAGVLIVSTADPAGLASVPGVTEYARDVQRFQVPSQDSIETAEPDGGSVSGCASTTTSCGRQWDLARIHVPAAWNTTRGAGVRVAVIDTGLNSLHEEVGSNYDLADSRSFVQPSSFCPGDAATFSSVEDFNGHGTWTNTHVAGRNGSRMTGIAPDATLINIRVLGACGFGFDSWVLNGMIYGGQAGAQVESMSLGGYLCGEGVVPGSFYCGDKASVGEDQTLWHAYQHVVDFLKSHGTIVVAAAGNDHVQLDRSGMVVSHGTLAAASAGNDPANDYFGLTEVPGGIPHVVAVAAVNRVTAAGTSAETRYGQYGVGSHDQLTYYSSYGDRIDVAAPGGARNYNVPRFDCISSNCGRLGVSPNTTNNPGDFGAFGIGPGGVHGYAYIQGTSMATPQVAGVAVLALASHPGMHSEQLVQLLGNSVTSFTEPNATPGIETDPSSPTYNFDIAYEGAGVSNSMMGAGVIDAAMAVSH